MLLFESLKDVSQETSTYSKLATEILKQDVKSVKSYIIDFVSLLTTCHMSKTSVKSFSCEHFFVYCDAFVFKITFLIRLLSILNRFYSLIYLFCYQP